MSRVTTDDIYALMDALRARKGPISAEDIHTLIERRGGPIIPKLPGHTIVDMKRLPKDIKPSRRFLAGLTGNKGSVVDVSEDRKLDELGNLVGSYPQPDGSIVRVLLLTRVMNAKIAYRVIHEGKILHEVPRDSCTSEPENIVRAPDGTWYTIRTKWAVPLSEHHPNVHSGVKAKDLVVGDNTLYLIGDGNCDQIWFRQLVHNKLGDNVTGIMLNNIPYKRWFTPNVAQSGYETEPTYLGETYVGKVGGENGQFETWIAQKLYPDTRPLLIGPNWDHVSQTFQDPEHGLCYWALAEERLYKVAFNPYG